MNTAYIIFHLNRPGFSDHRKALLLNEHFFKLHADVNFKYIFHQILFHPMPSHDDKVFHFHQPSHYLELLIEPYHLLPILPSSTLPILSIAPNDSPTALKYQSQGLICTSPLFTTSQYVQTFYSRKETVPADIQDQPFTSFWKAAQTITNIAPKASNLWKQPFPLQPV
jgi:hypothetical protein